MKKALLLFLSIGLFTGLQAQITIEFAPTVTMASADLDDPSTNPGDVVGHATVTNTSSETKTFKWNLIFGDHPESWEAAVCDVNTCYNVGTVTAQFDLAAGQTGTMDVHVYPSGNSGDLNGALPGMGFFSVKVSEIGNDDNNLTGDYEFNITGNPVTSLNQLEIAQLRLFPNPTSNFFQLEGPEGVSKIGLYNLLGREVGRFEVIGKSQSYDISHLARGMYLVSLLDEEDQLLKTVRLQKR